MTEHYRNQEGVIAFIFGGSVAKGMERPDSDLDGMVVPKPALKEAISACVMVILGNTYGLSEAALQPTYEILDKLDKDAWKYYITECLPFDDDVLFKIASGDRRTGKWCELVPQFAG